MLRVNGRARIEVSALIRYDNRAVRFDDRAIRRDDRTARCHDLCAVWYLDTASFRLIRKCRLVAAIWFDDDIVIISKITVSSRNHRRAVCARVEEGHVGVCGEGV